MEPSKEMLAKISEVPSWEGGAERLAMAIVQEFGFSGIVEQMAKMARIWERETDDEEQKEFCRRAAFLLTETAEDLSENGDPILTLEFNKIGGIAVYWRDSTTLAKLRGETSEEQIEQIQKQFIELAERILPL